MTRSIPAWLAPILEELELERPTIVTVDLIDELRSRLNVNSPTNRVIQELSERGWLLKTGSQGAWEFIPAERAAARSSGDPLLTVRATMAKSPDFPVALALGSAMWLHDLSDRRPEEHELAVPAGTYVPVSLRRTYRVVRYNWAIAPIRITGLPVHTTATVLVHLAHRPSDVRSWSGVLEALPELVAISNQDDIMTELEGRPHATRVRLAYLISDIAPQLVERMNVQPAGKVWFGPRGKLRRHSAQWNVADTILPFPPDTLGNSQ